MSARSIEPDLHAMSVEEGKWTHLDGTGLEYAPIGDSDHYAVRDKNRPNDEIRRAGDDFRKLSAVLGRGVGAGDASDAHLHDIEVDEGEYEAVEGADLEYAKVNDHDAYSVRDQVHAGDIRRPADDWRKLGAIL